MWDRRDGRVGMWGCQQISKQKSWYPRWVLAISNFTYIICRVWISKMKDLPVRSTTILFGVVCMALFTSMNYAWVWKNLTQSSLM